MPFEVDLSITKYSMFQIRTVLENNDTLKNRN